jgi:hypothetical protein
MKVRKIVASQTQKERHGEKHLPKATHIDNHQQVWSMSSGTA